jgi:hypothetical protein
MVCTPLPVRIMMAISPVIALPIFIKGGYGMVAFIVWETDMKKAIARAKSENKPILFRYRRRFIGQYQF